MGELPKPHRGHLDPQSPRNPEYSENRRLGVIPSQDGGSKMYIHQLSPHSSLQRTLRCRHRGGSGTSSWLKWQGHQGTTPGLTPLHSLESYTSDRYHLLKIKSKGNDSRSNGAHGPWNVWQVLGPACDRCSPATCVPPVLTQLTTIRLSDLSLPFSVHFPRTPLLFLTVAPEPRNILDAQ